MFAIQIPTIFRCFIYSDVRYSDPHCIHCFKVSAPFEVYNDENAVGNSAKTSAATPFTIYCDNEPESDPSPIKMTSAKKDSPPRVSLPRPKFGKPLSVHKDVPAAHHTPVDKENMPGE